MSFDRIADVYWLLEKITFGQTLQRARTFGVDKLSDPKRALLIGEGDGRFLEALLRAHRNLEVDCVDGSARMLELARQRLERRVPGGLARIRFLQSDIRDAAFDNRYDVIVTNFVLDCFEGDELKTLVTNLVRAALPGCVWLLADFSVPDAGWRKLHAKAWIGFMYRFFRLTTDIRAKALSDPAGLLQEAGFALKGQKRWRAGMVKSEVWEREATKC
ncbi:MAG: class I SAM-dependent methyltransferase [Chthoniobacterales bacterium]